MAGSASVEEICERIRGTRFRYTDEDQLQEGLALALAPLGEVQREVRLDARNRLDLLVGDVAIEVKVHGTANALARQLRRYAEDPRVGTLIVVSNRVRHAWVPEEINGKRVYVITLTKPW